MGGAAARVRAGSRAAGGSTMRHMHRLGVLSAALALAAVAVGLGVVAQRQQGFPHEEHAGLFPLCEGCHVGVASGDRASFYPPPSDRKSTRLNSSHVKISYAVF